MEQSTGQLRLRPKLWIEQLKFGIVAAGLQLIGAKLKYEIHWTEERLFSKYSSLSYFTDREIEISRFDMKQMENRWESVIISVSFAITSGYRILH